MSSKIELTRISNDTNGNPRYVCHFLNLLNDKDEEQIKNDFAASLSRNPFQLTAFKYEAALSKSRKIGGKKYNNKKYGGGIVFQSYNIYDLEKQIIKVRENNY